MLLYAIVAWSGWVRVEVLLMKVILSISQDVFIVFSSNIFAILGLRALYFVLEAMGNKFQYISYAVI
ncbi:hypothetical protein FACS1894176_08770 [Bacteroidia bacterium]|nr:hypothetical protein FACS1894176_08770 [Bacteroidia bacterium]